MVELNPTHEVKEGVDVVYQIPPNPKAILFLAHVRRGGPFTFWPSTPSVPEGEGTPEHKKVVKDALEHGFAVIASHSITDEWETWPTSLPDVQNAVKILEAFRKEHGLEHLPLSAWGSSCGGDFASTLAHAVKVHSLVIMISHGHEEALKAAKKGEYPPTLFVPMTKDENNFTLVKKNVAFLISKGIPAAIVEAPPHKVTPKFLSEHLDDLNEEQAEKLHAVFLEHGVVAEDGTLNKVLMGRDIEPYLEQAGLGTKQDEGENEGEHRRGPPGGGRGHHGRGHHRGPPSERGEGPPGGQVGEGDNGERAPPSERGEGRPEGKVGEGENGQRGARGGGSGVPPSERGEGPPGGNGGDGEDGQRKSRGGGRGGPPSERGEGPPGGNGGDGEDGQRRSRGGGRGGPPSERGEGPGGGNVGDGEDGQRGSRGGGRGGPPSERGEGPGGRGGRVGGGREGGRGGRGGRGKSNPLASGVTNQLRVAEGQHTITARYNKQIFEWFEGKNWPNV